jgi:O-antigen ligase
MIWRAISLEKIAVMQAGVLLLFATWAFGGNIGWARTSLCIGGSLAVFVTAREFLRRLREPAGSLRMAHWLWPLFLLNIVVGASLFHPSFRETMVEGASVLVPQSVATSWPSSARPAHTWKALWLCDALFLVAFNLAFVVRQRRLLRGLLLAVAVNALVLAVFGTLQKLMRSPGLFFGSVTSPNEKFFASFIYQNHWGAFVVLSVAVMLGLIFLETRKTGYRDFWHSPAFAGVIAVVVLSATAPLSGSRACSLAAACLLGGALAHGCRNVVRQRRSAGRSAATPLVLLGLAGSLGLAGVLWVARPVIEQRLGDTREQITHMRKIGSLGSRAILYADTWQMAGDRIWFGWGLGAYSTGFYVYNTQTSPVDRLPVYYADAHSDWLQSVAEVGLIGTLLRVILFSLPLGALLRCRPWPVETTYLLGGCTLVLAYALVEFPFGCPAVVLMTLVCFFGGNRLALLQQRDAAS